MYLSTGRLLFLNRGLALDKTLDTSLDLLLPSQPSFTRNRDVCPPVRIEINDPLFAG
jgi:hypothetical protein